MLKTWHSRYQSVDVTSPEVRHLFVHTQIYMLLTGISIQTFFRECEVFIFCSGQAEDSYRL